MNFDEMILEAAKSIAAATSTLVKAASAAQRELIDSGKMSRTPLTSSDDGQWSEGLISAARLVAAATHSLVESANALVQGLASEEKLISSAKQVGKNGSGLDPESCEISRQIVSYSTNYECLCLPFFPSPYIIISTSTTNCHQYHLPST